MAMGCNSEYCYSGGTDTRIHCWRVPDLGMDPYDGYGRAGGCTVRPPVAGLSAAGFAPSQQDLNATALPWAIQWEGGDSRSPRFQTWADGDRSASSICSVTAASGSRPELLKIMF